MKCSVPVRQLVGVVAVAAAVATTAATGAAAHPATQGASTQASVATLAPAPETSKGPQARLHYYGKYLQLTWATRLGAPTTWEAGRAASARRFGTHVVAGTGRTAKVNIGYRLLPQAKTSNPAPFWFRVSTRQGPKVGRVGIPLSIIRGEVLVNPARGGNWKAKVTNVVAACTRAHAATVVADGAAAGIASDLSLFLPEAQKVKVAAVIATVQHTKGGAYVGCLIHEAAR